MTDFSVKRDHWDRPWVTTDGGPLRYNTIRKSPVNATAYTRISTLAGTLDDKSGLVDWAAANAAVGVVRDVSLYSQLAHLVSAHDDPWNTEAKGQLKSLVERAQRVAGSDSAAGLGTAFHGLTELVDRGVEPQFVPVEMRAALDAYREVMADWEVLGCEVFVVVDELKAAGSVDRVLRHRSSGRIVLGDLKTGTNEPDWPLKVTVQVAAYSRGQRYNQVTGERFPLQVGLDLERGLLIHVPIRAKKPKCVLYPLDLELGWRLAQMSVQVRELRKMKRLVAL